MCVCENKVEYWCEKRFKRRRKILSTIMKTNRLLAAREQLMFLDMDDDCIETICNRLPLHDLCSFSLTCKRVYNLTNRYFNRKYKNHRMEIVNESSGPRINTNECYAKCFQSNIQNIRITSLYWNLNPIHLFTFLRLNCCENLNELEFDTINFKANQTYGDQIHIQLANLTTISFINCTHFDIYNGFLRYCQRLQHLSVKEEKPIRMNCAWMLHKYPHLKSLVYHASEFCYNVPRLAEFLQLNGHIKNIGCSGNRILLNIIANANITLDYLWLRIEHASLFNAIYERLQSMCQQKIVQRLKLDFGWYVIFTQEMTSNLATLAALATLDGLSFAIKELQLISYHPIIRQRFENLRSLNLEMAYPITETIFHVFTVNVPNLEEIHFHPWWSGKFIDNFRICIGILAAKFKQLNVIAIYQIDESIITSNSIIQMNIWRKQLSNACPLTIYLPDGIIRSVKFNMPIESVVMVKSLSSLKRDIYSCERRA